MDLGMTRSRSIIPANDDRHPPAATLRSAAPSGTLTGAGW